MDKGRCMVNSCGYKPLSFWGFNGDMNDSDIEMQIKAFKTQGFGGFFMHARAGLEVEYFSNRWFAACQKAIDAAKSEGLEVWLYDEDGWPSGFGGGRVSGLGVEYQAKKLCCCKGELPDDVTLLAVYREQNNDVFRISVDECTPNDLMIGYKVLPNYTDLLDRKVTEKFIEIIHEEYKCRFGGEFGKTIKGFFTDEPQLIECAPYSFCLEEEYKNRYGRELLDDLGLIFTDNAAGDACRYRYWKCVSEVFVASFTKQIFDWCEENGLEFTGHFAGEDGLCDQVAKSGDLLSHYMYMQRPGIDHLGNRLISAVAVKQVGDIAELCGRKTVLSESFGCSGWDVSFADLARIASWQRMFGVNCTTIHLSAFSLEGRRKRDYPAFFSQQEPWWERFGTLSSNIADASAFAMEGENADDILLLQPLSGMWSTLIPGCFNERARDISAQFRATVEALIDAQLRFTVVNDNLLNRFNITNGALCFGGRSYKKIIVAETPSLCNETADLLEKFSQAGGEIVFINSRPGCVDGDKNRKFKSSFGKMLVNRREMLCKYAQNIGYYKEIVISEHNGRICAPALATRVRRIGDDYLIFVMQPYLRGNRRLELSVCGKRNISILEQGKETELYTYFNEGITHAEFDISYGQQIIFKTSSIKQECPHKIELACEKRMHTKLVSIEGDNYLNIDRAVFTVGGETIKTNNIVTANEKIFDIAFKNAKDTEVTAEYHFWAEFNGNIPEIYLLAESKKANAVILNGVDISDREDGWEIDKAIKRYYISDLVKMGENVVLLKANILKNTFDGQTADGKFETERNRFIYPIEFESIYIKGDFDVKALTEVTDNRNFYRVDGCAERVFAVVDRTEKTSAELTAQNLWFFAGNAMYSSVLTYNGEEKVEISADMDTFPYAEVFVNQKPAGEFAEYPSKVDITRFLKNGDNTVEVKIYGHYRNLFGPHHHIKGTVNFVGPDTFAGRYAWEDFVNPDISVDSTWTDAYSFVPFCLKGLYVRYFERSARD